MDVEEGTEGYVEYWTTRLLMIMKLIKMGKGIEEYERYWRYEKSNTRRKMLIVRRTRLDKNAEWEEYYIRKGRMMGIKGEAKEEEIEGIKDLRMTSTRLFW